MTLGLLLVYAPSLARYPAVFVDEPWDANRAWNRLLTGENFTTIDVGPYPDGRGIATPPLASAALMWSYRWLGLGLVQTRLPALLSGGVLLLASYWAGRYLYDPSTGLLALALLGVSPFFLLSSHLGRPDMLLAAVIMVAFASAVYGLRSDRSGAHLLAGFLITLSYEVHQNAVLFLPGLLLCYPLGWGRSFLRKRGFWFLLLGGIVGALIYRGLISFVAAAISALVSDADATGQNLWTIHGVAGTHRPPIADPTPLRLLQSFLAEIWFRFHPRQNAFELVLIAAALLFLAWRRSRSDRLLLAFAGTAFVLFVLLIQNKVDHYTILLYPYLMLAVAAAFTGLLARKPSRPWRIGIAGLLAVMLVGGAAKNALAIYQNRTYDYYAMTDRIRSVVPPGSRVLARPTLWLGLHDYEFRSTITLTDYHYLHGYTLQQGIEAFRPDTIVVDDGLRRVLVDSDFAPAGGEGKVMLNLPRRDFEQFLERHGRKVLEFENPWHGPIEVYRIAW